jgi:hypothetical protein
MTKALGLIFASMITIVALSVWLKSSVSETAAGVRQPALSISVNDFVQQHRHEGDAGGEKSMTRPSCSPAPSEA